MQIPVRFLVCYYKPARVVKGDGYVPIMCGRDGLEGKHRMVGDDTGENISWKNGAYSELTALYWEWRNHEGLDGNEIVGMCHYRRFFDFHKRHLLQFGVIRQRMNTLESFDLCVPEKIKKAVGDGAVVVPKPRYFTTCNRKSILSSVPESMMKKFESFFKQYQGEAFCRAYDEVMYKRNYLMAYNMFIMRRSDFNAYCAWLFPMFEKFERQIDMERILKMRFRLFGYLSERLFNVWLLSENKELIYKPVVWFDDTESNSTLIHKIRVVLKTIGF